MKKIKLENLFKKKLKINLISNLKVDFRIIILYIYLKQKIIVIKLEKSTLIKKFSFQNWKIKKN